jgi:phage terminase large subunit-like protein
MPKNKHVEAAISYAKEAADEKNRRKYGKWIRLAAQRFLNDLRRAKKKDAPFTFSDEQAGNACEFVELLPHVEGKWDSPDIVLHRSDVFFIVNLFGFRKTDGTRRFTTALKAIARKNAKSTLAAAIALYCQVREDEEGPQVVSGATTGSQARIVWGIAKRMVEKKADMREAFAMEAFANSIASYSNGGSFKPINAKASTQDGLNPSCVVLDEIHAHPNGDLLNVLQSAAGARRSPLFLFTTTEGYESPGPWAELRNFAKQVLEGIVEADHFLAVYYAIDEEDDDFDETAWIKANPLMECNPILLAEIRKAAIEAKAMPGKMAEFRIKRLNRQSANAQGWIQFDKWKLCSQPIDLEWLRQYPCYGGLDLASTSDLCSFRLVWLVEGIYYTWGRRWVPENAVKSRTVRGSVPYSSWVESGHLEQTQSDVTDFDVVEAAVLEAQERFDIKMIGYDQWNAKQLVSKLEAANVPLELFVQGPKSYHPAMQEFERAYISGNFRYGTDPVLTWCAANIVTRLDVNLNMAPDKKKSADKIDDMVALLMAFGMALNGSEVGEVGIMVL